MLFFNKKIILKYHAKVRMRERILSENATEKDLRNQVLKDFQVKSIRRKTPKDQEGNFKVWVHGARLYACRETDKCIYVKTVIQMLPEDEERIKDEIDRIILD